MYEIVYIFRGMRVSKYPLLGNSLEISEDQKYNEFAEIFRELHTLG